MIKEIITFFKYLKYQNSFMFKDFNCELNCTTLNPIFCYKCYKCRIVNSKIKIKLKDFDHIHCPQCNYPVYKKDFDELPDEVENILLGMDEKKCKKILNISGIEKLLETYNKDKPLTTKVVDGLLNKAGQ